MTTVPRWPCLSAAADEACALLVAVIPNAKRTEAIGLHDGCLRVRLQAPPLEGRANDALVAWIASQLGLRVEESKTPMDVLVIDRVALLDPD